MAKRSRSVKRHGVTAHTRVLELAQAASAIGLEVSAEGEKVGHVVIGRGSVTWFGRKSRTPRRFRWTEFARRMEASWA